MESSEDSDEEVLFPIVYNDHLALAVDDVFLYDDPLLVTGVLRAVVEGDLPKVKYLVNSGKSVNINDNNGNTPLHVAVIKNCLEILDYLLDQDDIVVNIRNFKGETPLFQAVKNGRVASVASLIRAGANVNLPNYEDVTPLHISVTRPQLAHMLILHGAYIDAVDYCKDTPLHDATADGCVETVCMLLYYNADANVLGGNDLTPFMKALISENEELQHILFEYVDDFNRKTGDHMTTLALALTHDTPYVKEMIKRGANVNYDEVYLCDDIACAFTLLLRVPDCEKFKCVWDKLIYNEVTNSIDLCALIELLDKKDCENYLETIIESDNIKTAVDSITKNENYYLFITKFAEKKMEPDLLTKLTCRLILHEYRLTGYDIFAIYVHYDYCELLKILLYMDNDYSWGWLPYMILPRLIFDIDCKLCRVAKEITEIDKFQVLHMFEYFIYPPLMNAYWIKYRDDNHMSTIMNRLPKIPLLIELARNKAREHIATKFKTINSCQLYTVINYLDISSVYKKILTYETKPYSKFGLVV